MKLEQAAMKTPAMSRERAEAIYADKHCCSGCAELDDVLLSHERLRMELDGAKAVIAEHEEMAREHARCGVVWRPIDQCEDGAEVLLVWRDGSMDHREYRKDDDTWCVDEDFRPTHFAIVNGPEVGA